MLQGCWIIPGVEGQRESRRRRRPCVCGWRSRRPPPCICGKAPLLCFLCLVWPALCLGRCARVLGMDGLREQCAGSPEPREHHSGRLCVSPGQPAQPRHRALSSGSYLGGLEADMLLLLQENVFCSKCVRGRDGHVRCPGPAVTQAERHQGSREVRVKVKEQGAGGV